jgi:hypothetical protein
MSKPHDPSFGVVESGQTKLPESCTVPPGVGVSGAIVTSADEGIVSAEAGVAEAPKIDTAASVLTSAVPVAATRPIILPPGV